MCMCVHVLFFWFQYKRLASFIHLLKYKMLSLSLLLLKKTHNLSPSYFERAILKTAKAIYKRYRQTANNPSKSK